MYAGDGEMEIDNNLVENAIRPNAIGKKNWLFFGSERGGSLRRWSSQDEAVGLLRSRTSVTSNLPPVQNATAFAR